ncbi:uncharacterized protein [Anas platyrhynchos]|uniref:uncharacterized protein isoform X8 n=1 Tax=Anas platyrhynchos TaxID=8839 RepID=UPI003AF1EBB8
MDSCWDQGERDVTMPPGSKEVPKIPSSGGMKQITLSSELPTVTSPNCSDEVGSSHCDLNELAPGILSFHLGNLHKIPSSMLLKWLAS